MTFGSMSNGALASDASTEPAAADSAQAAITTATIILLSDENLKEI